MTHWTRKVLGDPTTFVQTVTVDGEPAGSVVAWSERDERFIGYWLGRQYWGRGVGTEALTLFLRRETTRPLYADPFAGNTSSVRLLEKCGFHRVGTVRHGEYEHTMLVLLEDGKPAGLQAADGASQTHTGQDRATAPASER